MIIESGLTHETSITVQESDTARAGGGANLPPVLSTPKLISYLERTAHAALLPHLEPGQSSVGTMVSIRHLAATPVGMQARFRAELIAVDGRKMTFKIEAWDAVEKIAEGEHERFVIDVERFEGRLLKKTQQAG
ncbi:MAG TPA: thioesterase family protein [Anaerolineaceae bacterium]